MRERGAPRELAERVLPPARETLRGELRVVQPGLGVAVGVNAGGLREYVAADDRRVVSHRVAAGRCHELAQLRRAAFHASVARPA